MHRLTTAVLKTLLAVLLAGLVTAQALVVPALAAQTADQFPELTYLQVPMTLVVALLLGCVEVAVLCLWRLLSMVRAGSIFSTDAFRYVDLIVAAVAVATVVVVGLNWFLSAVVNANPPLLALSLLGLAVGGAALTLLMVVMKALLRRASELEHDLSEVI